MWYRVGRRDQRGSRSCAPAHVDGVLYVIFSNFHRREGGAHHIVWSNRLGSQFGLGKVRGLLRLGLDVRWWEIDENVLSRHKNGTNRTLLLKYHMYAVGPTTGV